jgi:hypothetical protein
MNTVEVLIDFIVCGLGVYVRWFWPQRVRESVLSGQITEVEGEAKLKKWKPHLGFPMILLGLLQLAHDFGVY